MSVSSAALPNLTEAPLTPFCQFRQFLTWGFARNSLAFSARLGRGSVVRGGAQERLCDALEVLRAFSAAWADKTTDDRAWTPNGGLSLSTALRTDKLDKRPRDPAEGWGAEDLLGEIIRPKSGAGSPSGSIEPARSRPRTPPGGSRVPSCIGETCRLTTGGDMHRQWRRH